MTGTVSMKVMHILIANSQRAAYRQYKSVFEAQPDMAVVGYAACAEELLFQVAHSDVILLEAGLCRERTVGLVEQIRQQAPETQVLLTGIEEEGALIDEALILRYVEAGATGYILAREQTKGLLRKVRAAGDGRALISPRIAARLIRHLAQLSARTQHPLTELDAGAIDSLTPRQEEVLGLIAEGMTNQEIAQRLEIGLGTVKNHVHQIFRKLKVSNRYAASSLYRRWQQEREFHLIKW